MYIKPDSFFFSCENPFLFSYIFIALLDKRAKDDEWSVNIFLCVSGYSENYYYMRINAWNILKNTNSDF